MIVNRFNWLKTLKSEGKKYLSCTHYTSHSYFFFISPIYTLYIFLMFIEIPYKILNIWYRNTYKTTLYWHWRHNLPRQKFSLSSSSSSYYFQFWTARRDEDDCVNRHLFYIKYFSKYWEKLYDFNPIDMVVLFPF